MAKHLPFSEFDMAGITTAVNRYKSAGLRADYDIQDKAAGVVKIALENPMSRDGSFVFFEIHKLTRPGWLGEKAWWVIQLWSKGLDDVSKKHGCVSGRTQAYALTEAETDLHFNFMSICDFELASNGWDNRTPARQSA